MLCRSDGVVGPRFGVPCHPHPPYCVVEADKLAW